MPSNSGIPSSSIATVEVISSNVIWVGTYEGGIVKMTRNLAIDEVSSVDKKSFVYPNPTKNEFSIKNNENTNFDYYIYDLMGKLLIKGEAKYNEIIYSSELSTGSYIVKTSDTNNIEATFKFIKE